MQCLNLGCYHLEHGKSFTGARIKVWLTKVVKTLSSAPKQESLVQINKYFKENVATVHLQVASWQNAPEPALFCLMHLSMAGPRMNNLSAPTYFCPSSNLGELLKLDK